MIEKRKALVQISARVSKDVLEWHTQAAKTKNVSLSEHIHFILDDYVASSSLKLKNPSANLMLHDSKDIEDYRVSNSKLITQEEWIILRRTFAIDTTHLGTIIFKTRTNAVIDLGGNFMGFCQTEKILQEDNIGHLERFIVTTHSDMHKNISLSYHRD